MLQLQDLITSKIECWINMQNMHKTNNIENEAQTKASIINQVLAVLGWDISNYQEVCLEYELDGEKIDYIINHQDKPLIMIEAKHVNAVLDEIDDSKYKYQASKVKVEYLLLTNGLEWRLFSFSKYYEEYIYLSDLKVVLTKESVLTPNTYGLLEYFSKNNINNIENRNKLNNIIEESVIKNSINKILLEDDVIDLISDKLNFSKEIIRKIINDLYEDELLPISSVPINAEDVDPDIEKLKSNLIGKKSSNIRWRNDRIKYIKIWEYMISNNDSINEELFWRMINNDLGQSTKGNGPFKNSNISENGNTLLIKNGNNIIINHKIKNEFREMIELMKKQITVYSESVE